MTKVVFMMINHVGETQTMSPEENIVSYKILDDTKENRKMLVDTELLSKYNIETSDDVDEFIDGKSNQVYAENSLGFLEFEGRSINKLSKDDMIAQLEKEFNN